MPIIIFVWETGVWVDDLISLFQTVFGAIVMHRILYTPQHCSHDSLIVFRSAVAVLQWVSASLLRVQFKIIKERTGKGINKKSSLAQLVHFNPPQMLSLSCFYY